MTEAEIGAAIRAARHNAGHTIESAMVALRQNGATASVNTVARWERTGSIRVADALALCAVYGVTIDRLLASLSGAPILFFTTGGDGEPPRDRWWDAPLVLLAVALFTAAVWGIVWLVTLAAHIVGLA
jgi:transcriptional regulator with XRE-family HTH domain